VAALSKAWACNSSLAGIAGSNRPGGGGDGYLSLANVVCCQVELCVCPADPSSRGFPPSVCVCVRVSECDQVQQ
jgi:hypothetical protein